MVLGKKNGLEKTGGGLRDKEEMVIHVTNKLVVNVTVNETEKNCPFDATSAKGCMSLRLLRHIGKKFEFCCLQTVGLTLPWGGRSAKKREEGRGQAAPQG